MQQRASEARVDEAAFTEFMNTWQDMVYSTAWRITADREQAADIAQETFLRAYDHFAEIHQQPTVAGWLKTVASRLAINHLQRYRRRWVNFSSFETTDTDEAPEAQFADEHSSQEIERLADTQLLEHALAGLPDHQRVPLVLCHVEERSMAEVAEQLGISIAKLKTDLFRGRGALRRALAELDPQALAVAP